MKKYLFFFLLITSLILPNSLCLANEITQFDTVKEESILNSTNSTIGEDLRLNQLSNEIIKHVDPSWTDFHKALFIHDWLCENVEYDYITYNEIKNHIIPLTNPDAGNAYGAISDRKAVCDGFSKAYEYLLNKINIPCKQITSITSDHAWNLTKINDKWYYVDCTWDEWADDDTDWSDVDPDDLHLYRHAYFLNSRNACHDGMRHETGSFHWSAAGHNSEDWIDDNGNNVYNDETIATENYPYTAEDLILPEYTDPDYNPSDYEFNKEIYSSIDVLGECGETQIRIENGITTSNRHLCLEFTKGDKITEADSKDIGLPEDRNISGITGYENGKISYISTLQIPYFDPEDRYANPYDPKEHTADISRFVNYLTISYDLNGGDSDPIPPQKVQYGDYNIEYPKDPTRSISNGTKYEFTGWYYDPECTKKECGQTITDNLTLYAGWKTVDSWSVIVECELNGGSHPFGNNPFIGYYDNDTHYLGKPDDPVKEGCSFAGWYTDAELTKPFDFDNPLYNDITLYAKWDSNENSNENNNENINPDPPAPKPDNPEENNDNPGNNEDTPVSDDNPKPEVPKETNIQTKEAVYNGYIATVKLNKSVPFTKKKKEVLNNLTVTVEVKDPEGNPTGIYLKSKKSTKPKNGTAKITLTLKGSNKAERKIAKKLNKQLKKIPVEVKDTDTKTGKAEAGYS